MHAVFVESTSFTQWITKYLPEKLMVARKRKPLFERLKQGLEEGITYSKGELTLKTVRVPEEPPEIDAATVIALREQTEMSQAVFARMLNVSTKTVQSWEQGRRKPSQASRRLMQVFSERPEVVCQIVGLPGITLHGVKTVAIAQGRRKIVVKKKVKPRK
jgi:putative transcriptional regulator